MEVFHGTNDVFDSFDLTFSGKNTINNATNEYFAETAHLGFWFTDNCEKAAFVYDTVLSCQLNIHNPYYVNTLNDLATWFELTGKKASELRQLLMSEGYDSIIVDYDEEFEGRSFIVFNAQQIEIMTKRY